MDLLFAFGAGVLTLINPCVLPLLPVVIGAARASDARGPIALTAGMCISFVALGMFVATLGTQIGLDEMRVQMIGATVMVAFGLTLIVPVLARGFARATAPLSRRADRGITTVGGRGLGAQFTTGALLGAVWGPCVGPTLGGAIALAYAGQSLGWSATIMLCFALGVSAVMLAVSYGSRGFSRSRRTLGRVARWGRWIMGATMVLVGLIILTGALHLIEGWMLDNLPPWLIDFSTIL